MSTTLSLVVDNFQSPDNGDYVCQARNGIMTVNSSTLSLTGECGCESTVVIKLVRNRSDTLLITNMWLLYRPNAGLWFMPATIITNVLL